MRLKVKEEFVIVTIDANYRLRRIIIVARDWFVLKCEAIRAVVRVVAAMLVCYVENLKPPSEHINYNKSCDYDKPCASSSESCVGDCRDLKKVIGHRSSTHSICVRLLANINNVSAKSSYNLRPPVSTD